MLMILTVLSSVTWHFSDVADLSVFINLCLCGRTGFCLCTLATALKCIIMNYSEYRPVSHIVNNPNRQTNNFLLLRKINIGNEGKTCILSAESSSWLIGNIKSRIYWKARQLSSFKVRCWTFICNYTMINTFKSVLLRKHYTWPHLAQLDSFQGPLCMCLRELCKETVPTDTVWKTVKQC